MINPGIVFHLNREAEKCYGIRSAKIIVPIFQLAMAKRRIAMATGFCCHKNYEDLFPRGKE
jgi:hypothetical protein